jgi:hypothetical protein
MDLGLIPDFVDRVRGRRLRLDSGDIQSVRPIHEKFHGFNTYTIIRAQKGRSGLNGRRRERICAKEAPLRGRGYAGWLAKGGDDTFVRELSPAGERESGDILGLPF